MMGLTGDLLDHTLIADIDEIKEEIYRREQNQELLEGAKQIIL
jgi:hypothetical protein